MFAASPLNAVKKERIAAVKRREIDFKSFAPVAACLAVVLTWANDAQPAGYCTCTSSADTGATCVNDSGACEIQCGRSYSYSPSSACDSQYPSAPCQALNITYQFCPLDTDLLDKLRNDPGVKREVAVGPLRKHDFEAVGVSIPQGSVVEAAFCFFKNEGTPNNNEVLCPNGADCVAIGWAYVRSYSDSLCGSRRYLGMSGYNYSDWHRSLRLEVYYR